MAKGHMDIELDVVLNTQQAKKDFKDLQDSLTKASANLSINPNIAQNIKSQIPEMQKELSKVQVALEKAFNPNTGRIDYTRYKQELAKYGLTVKDVSMDIAKMGDIGYQSFLKINQALAQSEIPAKRIQKVFADIGTTLKNTLRWQIASKGIQAVTEQIDEAYQYAQKLNRSLNDIRIVTGYSADKMADFAVAANDAAKALSASTLAYTKASLIYYQQGLNDKEVIERTNATIKMSNVTGENAQHVSSYMTAIWNNFADGSKTLEYYADVITQLGAKTAASSEEIAEGMEKFAAVGETVGLSYEYAAAAVTTVVDKTRLSADIVGTSFKTLFARLEGLSLGETLDDGTTLNKYSKALATVGVNIKDQFGQLKNMDQILDELGSKWETLNSDQQVALAQTVGGVRQYTQLISLMENYDAFKQNVDYARNSEGTLNQQQRIFEESWQGASKRLKASWEGLYDEVLDDELFIKMTDNVAELVDGVSDLVDALGGLKGILLQIAPIAMNLGQKTITGMISDVGYTAKMAFTGRDALNKEKRELLNRANAATNWGKNQGLLSEPQALIQQAQNSAAAARLRPDYIESVHEPLLQKQLESFIKMVETQYNYDPSLPSKLQQLNLPREQEMIARPRDYEDVMYTRFALPATGWEGEVQSRADTLEAHSYLNSLATHLGNADRFNIAINPNATMDSLKFLSSEIDRLNNKLDDAFVKEIKNKINSIENTIDGISGENSEEINTELYQSAQSKIDNMLTSVEQSVLEKTESLTSLLLDDSLKGWNEVYKDDVKDLIKKPQALRTNYTAEELSSQISAIYDEQRALAQQEIDMLTNGSQTGDSVRHGLFSDMGKGHTKMHEYIVQGTRGGTIKGAHDAATQTYTLLNQNLDKIMGESILSYMDPSQYLSSADIKNLAGKNNVKITSAERMKKFTSMVQKAGIDLSGVTVQDAINQYSGDKNDSIQIKLEEYFTKLFQQACKDYIESINKAEQDALMQASTNPEDQAKAINAENMQKNAEAEKAFVATVKDHISETIIPSYTNEISDLADQNAQAAISNRDNGKIRKDFDEQSKNINFDKVKLENSDYLFAAGQGVLSLASSASSVSNAFATLTDESSTLSQKIEAVTSSLGTTIMNLGMMGREGGILSKTGALGSIGIGVPQAAIAMAVVAALKTAYDAYANSLEKKADEKRKELQDNDDWRQENQAALEAAQTYRELSNSIQDSDESLEDFHDNLLSIAKDLEIQNAELLAQANAYGLLEERIKAASAALENENLDKAGEDFKNSRDLLQLGVERANLFNSVMQYAIVGAVARGVGGNNRFGTDGNTLGAGANVEQGESRLLNELNALGLEHVSVTNEGFTYDTASMSEGEYVQFMRFLGDVQTNAALYGGDSNEIIKSLNEVSDNIAGLADSLETDLETRVLANYRATSGSNNTVSSLEDYGERYEELVGSIQENYGTTLEQAQEYATELLTEANDNIYGQQFAIIQAYADQTGQEVSTVLDTYNNYTAEQQEILLRGMGSNASAVQAIIGSIDDASTQIENIQALIDGLDVSTLIDSLDAIYEFIDKLKYGNVYTEAEIEQLAYSMGFNSAEAFIAAFADSFDEVAGGKYVFTGVADTFRSQVGTYTTSQLMEYAQSGVDFNEVLSNIGDIDEANATVMYRTPAVANAQMMDEAYAQAAAYVSDPTNVEIGGSISPEELFRRIFGIDADAELTSEQVRTMNQLISNGTLSTETRVDANNNSYETAVLDREALTANQQQNTDNLAQYQEELTNAQNVIEAYGQLEQYQEQYEDFQSGDRTAFQEQLVTQYTTMEELQDLYEEGYVDAEHYHEALSAVATQEAEHWGISGEELAQHAEFLKENNTYLLDNADSATAVALANERANIALEDLYKNMDDYNEILIAGRRDSEQWTDTIEALGHDLQNMFNYDETVSEDFILENLTDIQAAADGDIDAVNRLQVAFAQMRVSEEDAALGLDDVWTEINAIDWDDLEIGVSMDTLPAMQSLLALMLQAGMTADAINDTFNALGFHMEYETDAEGKIISGTVKSYYQGTNKRGLNAKTEKGKKGSTKKKDEKEFRDEFERYYKITRQIKDQQDATERLNKAKERAFGKAKLEYLDQEANSMQREIDLQKEYLDEIRGYYASDKGNLEAFGATFDENGVLTNYEQLINSELDRYNQAVEAYNANQDEAAFESAEKRFNYFKDVLKQYDETNQLYQEQLDNLTDMQNKWYDMALQKTQLKVEMEIAIDDRDLELLEYALDRIEKKAFATAEALAKITQSVGDTLDKQKIYQDALEEILSRHGIDGIDAISSLSDEQIANLGFTQEEIDAIVEYNSNLLDTQKEIDKLQDEILNGPLKAFKEWNEEFDYQEDKIQRNIDLLNQYKNIADLIYSNSSAVGQEYIMSLMTNTYDSMVLGVDAARLELKANQEALEKAKQSYEEAIANGAGEETINTLKKNLREMEKAVEDSEDDMLKKTEEALKQAEELLKQTIENAKDYFKELTSVTDWDMTQFDRLKSIDDEYLDDYQKIYEFAKLTRDINNSIDDTDTIRGKERLREITQEIADIEAQGREVSQYEVDALRAKYELRLAEIALEDAQNAKSVVRMNRDNEGNWSYVYTADEDNVDKARQNYEDKLYEYQKLNSEFIKTQQENFLKLEQEYTDAMQKIAEDSSLSREDKEARLQETQAYYQRMAEIMSDQLGIALSKNSELYNKDWLDYSQHTGYKISMEEEYQTKLDDTYTGHLQPNIDSATQLLAQFTEAAIGEGGFYPSIIGALDEFADRQDEVLQAAGTSLMEYADDMQRSAEDIETTMDDAAAGMAEDFDTIMEKMAEINAASFDGLRDSVTDAISSINDLVAAYERLSNASNAAQNSSISASGGGLGNFVSNAGGGGDKGGGGTSQPASTDSSQLLNNRTIAIGMASFLWDIFGMRKTAEGSRSWNTIMSDTAFTNSKLGAYVKAHPGDDSFPNKRAMIDAAMSYGTEQSRVALHNLALRAFPNIYKNNYSFDTGGYTGAWGTEGRLAFLHQKELVLNAGDTENMLNIIQMVRDITSAIDTRASMASVANINNGVYGSVSAGAQALDQNVHIEANFPNVTDHNEIELALSNLVNQAAQYANRKS